MALGSSTPVRSKYGKKANIWEALVKRTWELVVLFFLQFLRSLKLFQSKKLVFFKCIS